MSRWRLRQLIAPFAAGVLVLYASGCRDLGKGEVHPTHATQAATQSEAHGDSSHGACTKADRAEYVHDPNPKFIGKVRVCSKETWANKAKNIACLTTALPSLSKGCAGCFADMASCALANCKMPCMFSSTSDGCNHCANTHCQPSLIKCTGVARADLP